MADTEYSVGLKDLVSTGLKRIQDQLDKTKKKFGSINEAIKKSMKPKSIEDSAKAAEKFNKGLKMLGPVVGQLAGKLGILGDGVEAFSDKMMEEGGAQSIFGKRLFLSVAALAAVAAALYGVSKAALFADEQTAKFQQTNMKIAGDLGPKYASMTKDVLAASMELSQQMGKPFADIATTIAESLNAGMDIDQAKRFASISNALEKSGKSGKDFLDLMNQMKSLKPGESIAKLVDKSLSPEKQQEQVNKLQETLNLFGGLSFDELSKMKDPMAALNAMMNAKGSNQLIQNAEDSVSATQKLSTAWDNMMAKVFASGNTKTAIQPLLDAMNDPATIESLRGFFEAVVSIFNWIIQNGALVAGIIGVLTVSLLAYTIAINSALLPIIAIVAALALLGYGIYKLYQMISENWENIKTFFSDLWTDMSEIGSNLIMGLWEGIKSKFTFLMDSLKSFGLSVIQQVKDIFGIHSPSKEFAIIGKYNVEGLNKGMEDELNRNVSLDNSGELISSYKLEGSQQTTNHNNTATITLNVNGGSKQEIEDALYDVFTRLNFKLG